MIVVAILVSLGIFILRDIGLGYKYYEVNNYGNVLIGVSQEETLIGTTIEEYIQELKGKGYYIAENSLNKSFINKLSIISKSKLNDNDIKNTIKESMDITLFMTKLIINGDDTIYYFKSDGECDAFVRKLNEFIEQETSVEGVSESYKLITSQEVVDNKIDSVKAERERLDAEAEAARIAAEEAERQKQQTVSRGGYIRSSSNVSSYSGGAPMASYVYISSPFGYRSRGFHTGVDFASSMGVEVYAWKSGTVVSASWQGGYGNFIVVDHGDGTVSRYAHLSGYAISAGETVIAGQTIGYVGSTGNSTGPHLHFEILINGDFVNPIDYL